MILVTPCFEKIGSHEKYIDYMGTDNPGELIMRTKKNHEITDEVLSLAVGAAVAKIRKRILRDADSYSGILEIAPHENIVVDNSGSYPESGFLEWAINVFGSERIVFGSDVPGRDFSVQLAKVIGASGGGIKRKILSQNMISLIGD